MSRKSLYRVSAVVFLVSAGLLIGFLVSRYIAIQNAIEACNPGYGLRPVEQPTEIHTQLTTFGKAENWKPPDAGRLVWVVKMKGKWILVGGPPPSPTNPAPKPYYVYECDIIIDALTGQPKSPAIQ